MVRRVLFGVLVSALVSAGTTVRAAVSVTIGTPTAGTSYKVGVGIDYSGNGSWVLNQDIQTGGVQISLRWYDPKNPGGSGVIVETDTPDITWGTNPNTGQLTGKYSFVNGVDQFGNSTLVADQYQGNATTYYFVARPISIHGQPYIQNNQVYNVARKLGTIQ